MQCTWHEEEAVKYRLQQCLCGGMGQGHPGTIQVNGIGNHTNEPETTQCCGNDFLVALVH